MPIDDRKKPARRYTAADIEVRERPVYRPAIHARFVILGFLEEYMGRSIFKDGDEIERFFPHETGAADRFELYLHMLKAEQNLNAPIERNTDEQGFIYFYSREITSLVDSCYGTDPESEGPVAYSDSGNSVLYIIRYMSYSIFKPITSARFKPEEYDDRFSYLLGAYHRTVRIRSSGLPTRLTRQG